MSNDIDSEVDIISNLLDRRKSLIRALYSLEIIQLKRDGKTFIESSFNSIRTELDSATVLEICTEVSAAHVQELKVINERLSAMSLLAKIN